jgi:hypothetical protein
MTAATTPTAADAIAPVLEVVANAHRAANVLPMMDADELESLTHSIRTYGFDPTKPIKRHGGKIVDGRNRQRAVDILNAEIDAYNATHEGEKRARVEPAYLDLPEEMDDAAILAAVLVDNFARRQLNSSQKAAVIIKADMLAGAYAKRDELKEQGKKLKGELAILLAKQTGTNHDYIYKLKKVRAKGKAGEALLDQIIAGEMNVMEAFRKIDDGAAKDAAEGAAKDAAEGAAKDADAAEGEVKDGLGAAVPEEWKEVFAVRAAVAAAGKLFSEVKKAVKEATAGKGGDYLKEDEKAVNAAFSKLGGIIKDNLPYAVCPHCDGAKKEPGKKKPCPVCLGVGYLNKPRYDRYQKFGAEMAAPAGDGLAAGAGAGDEPQPE